MKVNNANKQKGSNKLKYCIVCNSAWKLDAALSIEMKHADFPSYGLEREHCFSYKNSYLSALHLQIID